MEKKNIVFIMNTLGAQRKQDYSDLFFGWLVDCYERCQKYLASPEGNTLLANRIAEDFNSFLPKLKLMSEPNKEDITVSNYKERLAINKPELVLDTDTNGQVKLIMKRGGARKGAGRKKSDKEIRTVKIALDESTWIAIEAIKDIEEYKSMTQMLSELIERGLDRENIIRKLR